MDEELKELRALIKLGGRLKIITSEHVCGGGVVPSDPDFDRKECATFEHDLESPQHYFQADATTIRPHPAKKGAYIVESERGDAIAGYPDGLLSALRKWNR